MGGKLIDPIGFVHIFINRPRMIKDGADCTDDLYSSPIRANHAGVAVSRNIGALYIWVISISTMGR